MASISAFILAYLLGSIDFGVIVPRLSGVDIYEQGSGNPGTSNVLRTLGKKAAALVLLGDLLKGVTGAAVGAVWVGGATGFACGFAAVAGHIFPIWHRFRGGRGVATAIGAAIWLEPVWGTILAVGWAAIVIPTRTASLASLGAMLVYVPGFLFFDHRAASIGWAAAAAALVIVRHSGNIQRLLRREERAVTAE